MRAARFTAELLTCRPAIHDLLKRTRLGRGQRGWSRRPKSRRRAVNVGGRSFQTPVPLRNVFTPPKHLRRQGFTDALRMELKADSCRFP